VLGLVLQVMFVLEPFIGHGSDHFGNLERKNGGEEKRNLGYGISPFVIDDAMQSSSRVRIWLDITIGQMGRSSLEANYPKPSDA
jgi:hypothetical protein